MTTVRSDDDAIERLDFRIRLLLPEEYQESYETLRPTPMGAAGLRFDDAGRVAWDEIWGSFCDLAIAGGPPHKGALLAPGEAPARDPQRYGEVTAEICRGVTMVTGLPARAADTPGWIEIACPDAVTASWLLRAIVVENVAVHADGLLLYLPASSTFRLEKEIKNVVTVVAKTCHYWVGHMSGLQRAAIGRMLAALTEERPLLVPPWPPDAPEPQESARTRAAMDRSVFEATRCTMSGHDYPGWAGIECPNALAAVWMMRALVASNVLSRREGGVVFLPVNPARDAGGEAASAAFAVVYRLAVRRGVIATAASRSR